MSLMRVLLPLPLTPVTTVMTPRGMRMVTSWRLCSRAPVTVIHLPVRGAAGAMEDGGRAGEIAAGERFGAGHDSAGVPSATTKPPSGRRRGRGRDVVGVADGVFVVLDDEDGVAEVAELVFEGFDEALLSR
jgi:hypothetical protein